MQADKALEQAGKLYSLPSAGVVVVPGIEVVRGYLAYKVRKPPRWQQPESSQAVWEGRWLLPPPPSRPSPRGHCRITSGHTASLAGGTIGCQPG